VEGVFSADPRIVPNARKLNFVSFEEMLEMAASGARVLQLRSVEYGRNYGVRIRVRPSFDEGSGTLVLSEHDTMERPLVTGIAHSTDDARITLTGVPDEPGVAARIFTALAETDINVDMIIQNEPVSRDHRAELSFTVPKSDLASARRALEPLTRDLGFDGLTADEDMGTVAIIGAGMRSHPGVAAKVFQTLGDCGINIEMIATSPIKISCAIRARGVPEAVRALHEAFGLGDEDVRPEDPYGEAHRPKVAP
jgi:aspartate kinase